jgi:hypothetical protein
MTKIQVNSQGKAYISSGGKALLAQSGSATLITKSITQNGTYNASSDNADGYSSVTVNVGGTPTPTGIYQLFDRVKDDNNNEIGTVCGFFTDANNVEYALVVIDNSIGSSMTWGPAQTIPDLIIYNNIRQGRYWYRDEKNTATYNTQKILDSISSPMCTYCRTFSFTIKRTTYYGQMPNMRELFEIVSNNISIYPSTTFASSTQFARDKYYMIESSGRITWNTKNSTSNTGVLPILEIRNA